MTIYYCMLSEVFVMNAEIDKIPHGVVISDHSAAQLLATGKVTLMVLS